MDSLLKKPIVPILVFLALAWYIFFFRLDGMGLTDPDETFYAQTAKEMLSKGEWLTPHIFGKPQFEKPILFYWLIEISFKIFGVNETAARIPSAVCGMIGIAAVYLLGKLVFNRRTALIAAVILATSVEYVILSRACVTDMTLATLMLLGALFFFYGHMRGGKLHYLLSAAFFALAVMTKGPIAVLLPGLIFILYFALTGAWKNIRSVPIFWMAIVFVCIAAPWYVVMYKVHGAAFMDAFFGFQNVTRFMKAEHEIGSQIYYNIPILLVGFFPWSVFLPFGIWYAFKKAANDKNMGAVFSLIWFFAIFLFFTASSTKLPTYIFPCFFAAALLTAAFWDAFLEKNCPRTVGKAMTVSFYTLIAIVIPGAVGTHIYLSGHFPSLVKGVTISAAILTLGMILSLAAFVSGKRAWAFVMIAYSMLLFIYPTSGLILPEIDRFETSRPAAKELAGRMAPADKIGSASRYMEGLAFYAGKFPRDLDKYDDMIRFLNGKDRVWCVLKAKNRTQAYIADDLPQCSRDTYLVYRMGKRAIVTNMLPRDGEYIVKKDGIK